MQSEDYINLMNLMATDQYRPCWIELDEEDEADEADEEDETITEEAQNDDKFAAFYGKYDNEKTPKDEKAKLEKLYWEGKLSDE
jgi:hypothetical protein